MIRKAPIMKEHKKGYELNDGRMIYFDYGNFDEWCVYIEYKNGCRSAPKDIEYFQELKALAEANTQGKVYRSFLTIYDIVEKTDWNFEYKKKCFETCRNVSLKYKEDTLMLWLVLCMTMIAEENKENAILGKRIKHYAIYRILWMNEDINYVATSMNGVRWFILDEEMQEYGI